MHRYKFVLYRPLQFLRSCSASASSPSCWYADSGDPARVLLGTKSTPAAIAAIRAQYGLDQPMWMQYFYFLQNLAHGEMGKSILYKIDVLRLISTRIEPTLALVLCSVLLSLLIAVPLASFAARSNGGRSIHAVRFVSTLRYRLPALLAGTDADHLLLGAARSVSVSGYGENLLDRPIT